MDAEQARKKLARERRFSHMAELYQFVGGRREQVEMPVNAETQPVLEGFWGLVKFRTHKLAKEAERKQAARNRRASSSLSTNT